LGRTKVNNGMHIILVEDDLQLGEAIRQALERLS
jgi:DNA-binding response OmpR family regulator